MKEKLFELTAEQLKEIAVALQKKVNIGLEKDGEELACIPTYICPKTDGIAGKALVLDLGGTNYRAAVIELGKDGKADLHPDNGWKKDLCIMKTPGFTQEQLFKEQADLIDEICDEPMPIGYCFSYPAASQPDGDAKLIRWTKGVDIKEMVGQPVGTPLMNYLNSLNRIHYTGVKVINDTVASLFAGLTHPGYDAYIGLIVGTGTNMAAFIPAEKIGKIAGTYTAGGLLPVNFESGNFVPPYLTPVDDEVDRRSINAGNQRFEKAVSGMYLGEILKATFPEAKFEEPFDARKLTGMLSYPDVYKTEYVDAARAIYKRSAQLVAASLAGLINLLATQKPGIKTVCLTAEGSLFWSEDKNGKKYHEMVLEYLHNILTDLGHSQIKVDITQMDNANLIGSAIAALS